MPIRIRRSLAAIHISGLHEKFGIFDRFGRVVGREEGLEDID